MRSLAVAATLIVAVAGTAEARNVYLNGIKLDSSVAMKPQTFKDCEVRIDERGDIHITATGYKVVAPEGEKPAPPPGGATGPAEGDRRFWLISKFNDRGAAGFDVEVYINNTFVKKIRAGDDPLVLDVSRFIQPGDNRISMLATKNPTAARGSRSPADTLEVVLGEGIASGGTVTIDKVHATFKRNGSESGTLREDYLVTAR
jgi:hypothetical protein